VKLSRRKLLGLFGGLLAAVTAVFPALHRSNQLIRQPGLIGRRDQTPFPVWNGEVVFENKAVVNGLSVIPGKIYYASPHRIFKSLP
jgi:hypothetical protein